MSINIATFKKLCHRSYEFERLTTSLTSNFTTHYNSTTKLNQKKHNYGAPTSQYSLCISVTQFTFNVVNSTFYMVNFLLFI